VVYGIWKFLDLGHRNVTTQVDSMGCKASEPRSFTFIHMTGSPVAFLLMPLVVKLRAKRKTAIIARWRWCGRRQGWRWIPRLWWRRRSQDIGIVRLATGLLRRRPVPLLVIYAVGHTRLGSERCERWMDVDAAMNGSQTHPYYKSTQQTPACDDLALAQAAEMTHLGRV
jgi:hypothetical protein